MSFKKAAENQFTDSTRDELAGYCDILEIEYKPQHGVKKLRELLMDAMGMYHEIARVAPGENPVPVEPIPQHPKLSPAELIKLNLRSQGKWQGKRRKITLHRAMEYESTIFPHFFAWEGLHCYVPFGQPVDVPYSIYNVLLAANKGLKLNRKRKVDEDGRIFYEDQWLPTQRFMFTDFGVTPGTEHLPEDVQDQLRQMWHLTDGFDGYSIQQCRQLCRMLKISVREDWRASDMRGAMKRILGLTTTSELAAPEARTAKAG